MMMADNAVDHHQFDWSTLMQCVHAKIGFDWTDRFIKGTAIVIRVNRQHTVEQLFCSSAVICIPVWTLA